MNELLYQKIKIKDKTKSDTTPIRNIDKPKY